MSVMKPLRDRLQEKIPDEQDFEGAKTFGEPAIKQGTWLTTPLWNQYGWGIILRRSDVSWQIFMKAFGNTKYDFVRWMKNEKDWKDVMNSFIDQIIDER